MSVVLGTVLSALDRLTQFSQPYDIDTIIAPLIHEQIEAQRIHAINKWQNWNFDSESLTQVSSLITILVF